MNSQLHGGMHSYQESCDSDKSMYDIYIYIFIALCVGESKAPPVLYPSYGAVLKHGKGRAIMVLGVVSIDHYCAYSTSFCALTNTYSMTRPHKQ